MFHIPLSLCLSSYSPWSCKPLTTSLPQIKRYFHNRSTKSAAFCPLQCECLSKPHSLLCNSNNQPFIQFKNLNQLRQGVRILANREILIFLNVPISSVEHLFSNHWFEELVILWNSIEIKLIGKKCHRNPSFSIG